MTTTACPHGGDLRTASSTAPRAAYVHVPFCRHRCGYCNFTLVAGRGDLVDGYLRAIALELSALESPREVDTLYFGGGTPTYLSPNELRQLARTVLKWHPLARPSPSPLPKGEGLAGEGKNSTALGLHPRHSSAASDEPSPNPSLQGRGNAGYEWSVEANPSDVDEAMAGALAELGVTRVSLGAQSFRPDKLRLLERDHDARDIERAARLVREAGMSVALDLIFGTPGETLAQWAADLDMALALRPDHVSTYGLTFERGTAFWGRRLRGELVEVDEEPARDMVALAIDRLTSAGLAHYEVSNFARPGRRSRHNETYWSGDGYWAVGPGAARYVDGIRETNHRSTTTYLQRVLAGRSPVAEREQLAPEARAREQLVFGLRRIEGVSRREFAARTGREIDALIAAPLAKFVDLGLLADDGERIQLTRDGLMVSDALWPEML